MLSLLLKQFVIFDVVKFIKSHCFNIKQSPNLILFYQLLLILFIKTTKINATQRIVEHPQNITARLGETVILKCRAENQVKFLYILF